MASHRLLIPVVSLGLAVALVVFGTRQGREATDTPAPGDAGSSTCPPGFRPFTVTNQASQTVWIGQTAGAAPPPFTCTTDSDCGPNQACLNPGCTSSADCNAGNMCDTGTGQCMVAPDSGCNGGAPIVTVSLPTALCTGAKQVPACANCGPEGCDSTTGLCKCADGGQAACPGGTTCSTTAQECSLANGGTCYFQSVVPGENQACSSSGDPCPSGQSCTVALGLCQYARTDGGVPLDALTLTAQESTTLCMPSSLPPAFASLQPGMTACTQNSQCQSGRCLLADGVNLANPPTQCPEDGGASCLCRSPIGWSGGLFGRLGCQSDGTGCLSADCGNAAGMPCPLGKGGTNPFTAAEFTLQPDTVDFYDVTVINGANVSLQMGPSGDGGFAVANPPSPYSCGTAGSTSAQGNSTTGTLEACSWSFAPDTSAGLPADYTTLLRAVVLPACGQDTDCGAGTTCTGGVCQPKWTPCGPTCANGAVCGNPNNPDAGYCGTCTSDNDCAGDGGTAVCGTAFLPGVGGTSPLVQTCGQSIGWWSYEDLCSASTSFGYGPLDCSQTMTVQVQGGAVQDTLSNLFQCAGNFGSSCYNSNGNTPACCGCATYPGNDAGSFWPTLLEPGNNPSQQAQGQCYANNPAWAQSVQPWLAFLKKACPTAYTYAYDDVTSTFTCMSGGTGGTNTVGYNIVFGDVN
ncbi:Thaumatin family protein [Myxococcus fulvus]|uniref:Thaumatin family protein n=1 Tax=Myxococcus fulvus TaxID=33 RepID=A0A511SW99_MYXFU|nr:thaumatin family protein [Myxococcus fulvus]GEN05603.1 hypothetical protein MFU01_06400 [Myxococcus fulvus]SET01803.1 Thaumatin family protein [Myxococcus fulvus]